VIQPRLWLSPDSPSADTYCQQKRQPLAFLTCRGIVVTPAHVFMVQQAFIANQRLTAASPTGGPYRLRIHDVPAVVARVSIGRGLSGDGLVEAAAAVETPFVWGARTGRNDCRHRPFPCPARSYASAERPAPPETPCNPHEGSTCKGDETSKARSPVMYYPYPNPLIDIVSPDCRPRHPGLNRPAVLAVLFIIAGRCENLETHRQLASSGRYSGTEFLHRTSACLGVKPSWTAFSRPLPTFGGPSHRLK